MKFKWSDEQQATIARLQLTQVSLVTSADSYDKAEWIKIGSDYYRAKRGAKANINRDYIRLGNRTFWLFMADCTHLKWAARHEFAFTAVETMALRDYLASNSNYVLYRRVS